MKTVFGVWIRGRVRGVVAVSCVAFAAASSATGFTVGTASSMEAVLPRAGHVVTPAHELRLRLARGEKESLQLLVQSKGALADVRVRASDLVGKPGTIPSRAVDCHVVGYNDTHFRTNSAYCSTVGYCEPSERPPYYERKSRKAKDGWWPDAILDFPMRVDVAAGDAQSFWIRVNCPRRQSAGLYRGTVTVTAVQGGRKLVKAIPLTVRVNDFEVPRASPLPLAITWAPMAHRLNETPEAKEEAKRLDADPEGPVTQALAQEDAWGRFLADYYITMDCLYVGFHRHPLYANMEPRWKVLLKLKKEGRLGPFNLGFWGFYEGGEKEEAEWRKATLPRIRKNYEKAKAFGLLDKAYIYGCDEVSPKFFTNVCACLRILRREFPGVRFATTSFDDSFGADSPLKDMDMFFPATTKYDRAKAETARKAGRHVGWYICCGPPPPWANGFTQSVPGELRMLMGAQTVRERPEGFLYYQISLWNAKRPITSGPFTSWESRSFMDMNGDGCWTAVGPGGKPLATLRLENFRDGLEDYAYALLLEKKLKANPGAPWAARARELLDVPQNVMQRLNNFTDDPSAVRAWRDEMADLIEGLPTEVSSLDPLDWHGLEQPTKSQASVLSKTDVLVAHSEVIKEKGLCNEGNVH